MDVALIGRCDLQDNPDLADTMLRDRHRQFIQRLKWDFPRTPFDHHEMDAYDAPRLNAIYVIAFDDSDPLFRRHRASARALPTTGPCMVNDHFAHLLGGSPIRSPFIWEISRMVISPDVRNLRESLNACAAVLHAGFSACLESNATHALGVFYEIMIPIYRRFGLNPEIIGKESTEQGVICAGLFEVNQEIVEKLRLTSPCPERGRAAVNRFMSGRRGPVRELSECGDVLDEKELVDALVSWRKKAEERKTPEACEFDGKAATKRART